MRETSGRSRRRRAPRSVMMGSARARGVRASRPQLHHFVARSTSPSMFALTTPTTCVASAARPGPERPRGARGASLAGRHVGSTGGDRVAMRVGGARSARSVRTAATEGTRGWGFAPRRRRHRASNERRHAGKSARLRRRRASLHPPPVTRRRGLYPLPPRLSPPQRARASDARQSGDSSRVFFFPSTRRRIGTRA